LGRIIEIIGMSDSFQKKASKGNQNLLRLPSKTFLPHSMILDFPGPGKNPGLKDERIWRAVYQNFVCIVNLFFPEE
jgi:hypothetical protein